MVEKKKISVRRMIRMFINSKLSNDYQFGMIYDPDNNQFTVGTFDGEGYERKVNQITLIKNDLKDFAKFMQKSIKNIAINNLDNNEVLKQYANTDLQYEFKDGSYIRFNLLNDPIEVFYTLKDGSFSVVTFRSDSVTLIGNNDFMSAIARELGDSVRIDYKYQKKLLKEFLKFFDNMIEDD